MTTIAVARRDGRVAIAADTLTKWGGGKETADYIVNHDKLLTVGENIIGITGAATFRLILADYFATLEAPPAWRTPEAIFRDWNRLHGVLKERYYLQTGEDKEDELESSRMDVLIANPHGIFGVAAHRTVQAFSRFYAYGSGSPYALGAMHAAWHDASLSAEDLVRRGVSAAAEFHDETGLPLHVRVIDLQSP